jgi:molybdopterin synthase catalytic subunit
MQQIKLAQKGKQLSEEHKQSLKDNHWSKNGGTSPFKGKVHSSDSKVILRQKKIDQFSQYSEEELKEAMSRIKNALTEAEIH